MCSAKETKIKIKKLPSIGVRRRLLNERTHFTCMPENTLSGNRRMELCEKSKFLIGNCDVAKAYERTKMETNEFFI